MYRCERSWFVQSNDRSVLFQFALEDASKADVDKQHANNVGNSVEVADTVTIPLRRPPTCAPEGNILPHSQFYFLCLSFKFIHFRKTTAGKAQTAERKVRVGRT